MSYINKICGIYVVTHIESGRKYVGKSVHIKNRWSQHVQDCKKYNNRFCNALRKYGKSAFRWEILEECSQDALEDREQFWIATLDTVETGFNLTPGGDGIPYGFKHSPDERAAKSARQKGKPHSPEHNRKVADALKGRIIPPHVIDILRQNAEKMRGQPKFISLETRKKMADSNRGTKRDPEGHKKQWETRRAKYGETGISGECLEERAKGFSDDHLKNWKAARWGAS